MMAFERCVVILISPHTGTHLTLTHVHTCRYNKYIKNLVRDPNRPAINLANTTTADVSTRFTDFAKKPLYDLSKDENHICNLSGRSFNFQISNDTVGDLRLMRSRVNDANSCIGFRSANIMGTPFIAGKWPYLTLKPYPLI